MEGGIVMALGVERESETTVSLSVGGIHAERRARFGEGGLGIVRPVKQVRKLAVGFGEAGHQARRFCKCIERFVEPVLPAQESSEHIMQQGIVRIIVKQGADLVFGAVEVPVVNQSGNLRGRTGAGDGGVGG